VLSVCVAHWRGRRAAAASKKVKAATWGCQHALVTSIDDNTDDGGISITAFMPASNVSVALSRSQLTAASTDAAEAIAATVSAAIPGGGGVTDGRQVGAEDECGGDAGSDGGGGGDGNNTDDDDDDNGDTKAAAVAKTQSAAAIVSDDDVVSCDVDIPRFTTTTVRSNRAVFAPILHEENSYLRVLATLRGVQTACVTATSAGLELLQLILSILPVFVAGGEAAVRHIDVAAVAVRTEVDVVRKLSDRYTALLAAVDEAHERARESFASGAADMIVARRRRLDAWCRVVALDKLLLWCTSIHDRTGRNGDDVFATPRERHQRGTGGENAVDDAAARAFDVTARSIAVTILMCSRFCVSSTQLR
jgi:hypothetical protein